MNRLTRIASCGAIAAASFALAACGGDSGSESSTAAASADSSGVSAKKIAYAPYGLPTYFRSVQRGVHDQAKELGWEVKDYPGKNTVESQLTALENALTDQPDALVIGPIDKKALLPILKRFNDAKIPVIAVGNDVDDPSRRASYVGTLYEESGRLKGEWICNNVEPGGKVVTVFGIRGLAFTEDNRAGGLPVMEQCDNVGKVVEGPYAGEFSPDAGLRAAENVLAANPDVSVLWADNDDLALGVIKAVKNAGLSGKVKVTGMEGATPPILDAVASGDLAYTQALCGRNHGRETVKVAQKVLAGEPVESHTPTPLFELTSDNIEEEKQQILENCF